MGVVLQVQTGVDVKIIPPTAPTPFVQYGDSPTLTYASGTWTRIQEHERMIRSTQRKMLRLIVQTKRKYKKKTQGSKEEKQMKKDKHTENEKGEDEEEKKATQAPKTKV